MQILAFVEVNKKYPEDSEVKMLLSRIYFNKGVKLADKEKYKEAIKFLKISLSYDNSFPEAYAMLGSLYLQTDETEKADNMAASQPIIIDHTNTDITAIPQTWIESAKQSLHIAYGHTSHGSQLISGINASNNVSLTVISPRTV